MHGGVVPLSRAYQSNGGHGIGFHHSVWAWFAAHSTSRTDIMCIKLCAARRVALVAQGLHGRLRHRLSTMADAKSDAAAVRGQVPPPCGFSAANSPETMIRTSLKELAVNQMLSVHSMCET